ncbi:hypothetical protein VTJ83DRAFT_7350 [Remersonia thermophila]|uniref:Small ribosomal subunit protein bS18m n=1 Tax=Remersonia thermophila TaxID=72144 RepID=A0ABR4D4A0_9PEZI
MSSQRWLSSAARQCQTALAAAQRQQAPALSRAAAFSTSAPVADFRNLNTPNTTTSAAAAANSPSSASSASSASPTSPPGSPLPFTRPSRRVRTGSLARSANEALRDMLSEASERNASLGPLSAEERRRALGQFGPGSVGGGSPTARAVAENAQKAAASDAYLRQMGRRWEVGEVYSPRDLEPAEMQKWRKRGSPAGDVVDLLGFNPVDNYKNFALVSEFITPMGRIKHSSLTGLRPVNQRKVAKMVRRAIGLGLYPSVHKHPQILRLSHQTPAMSVPQSSNPSQNKL